MIRSASCGALVHRGDEAAVEIRRTSARCRVRCRASIRSQSSASSGRNVSSLRSPVSVSFLPIADLRKPVDLVHAFQHRLPFHLVDLLPAQKIRAALHQRDLQIRREMLLQEGHVFVEELLLKRFRRRRDDHAPPAANRRNQIRERLARAGARLDHHVLMLLERRLDNPRHLELRRAELIPRVPFFQQPARPENSLDGNFLRLRHGVIRARRLRFWGCGFLGCRHTVAFCGVRATRIDEITRSQSNFLRAGAAQLAGTPLRSQGRAATHGN